MPHPIPDALSDLQTDPPASVKEPRLWRDNGWTARVIKNNDDEGWAVEMLQDGEPEPALVGPWTMGRDKKNPKPLDTSAFNTLVKTASEVLRRHEQQLHATLHKQVDVSGPTGRWQVTLDIVADEYEPHALLAALDEGGDQVAQVRVPADFKLNPASAPGWIPDQFPQATLNRAGRSAHMASRLCGSCKRARAARPAMGRSMQHTLMAQG